MKRILIFSGTTEGRQLADILDASGICADVCVATGYGHEVMTEGQYRNIYTGRLTEEEMKEFMQKGDKAAISRSLKELTGKGFVREAESDGRKYRIPLVLTASGTDAAQHIEKAIQSAVEIGGAGLTDRQRAEFYHSLLLIARNLEEYSGT